MSENIDLRDYDELSHALTLAQHTVYKKYLHELSVYPVVKPTDILLDETAEDCVRFFQLKELSCKKGEDIFQKLSTVYYASMSLGCNLIVMVDVENINAPPKIYIGVRNNGENEMARECLRTSFRTLKNGIKVISQGLRLRMYLHKEKCQACGGYFRKKCSVYLICLLCCFCQG